MASSGTINGADGYKGFKIRIKWSTNSQSVANNSSNVNVGVYLVVPTNWSTTSAMKGSYTVNGSTININKSSATYTGGEHLLASSNFTINHNADGTKSFNMSATVTSGWTTLGTMPTASGSGTLDTIARASQPSINTYPNNSPDFNIGDTIKIHMNRASNSFTHTVVFNYGSTSVTVATNVADNCTFNTSTIANALYALIPNANVYSGTISVTTYNGSTNIGTKTCPYNAHVVNANPTFDAAYLDTNSAVTAVTTNNQLIVRNKSTLRINISNAAAKKSATLASARCVILGQTVTATLSGSSVALNIGTINTSQDTTAAVSVIDSRGNSTTINLNITVADWQQPTGIISLQRHNNYYSETDITVDANYSSVNNKNVITIKVRSKKQTTSTWGAYTTLQDNVTSVLTLDNEYAWDIQVLLTDSFGGSTTYNLTLSRGMPIVFFDRTKSSTGFNSFPQYDESVEIAGRLFVNNEDIVSKFTGIGGVAKSATTSDWNTACATLSGVYMGSNMSNAPEGSANWFYVFHMAHNNLYQRQVAYDFFGINIWTRRMDNGTWYPWYRLDLVSGTYSTTEARTGGTFIDDKPIYKKTIDLGSQSGGETNIAHGITDLDKVIKVEGVARVEGDPPNLVDISVLAKGSITVTGGVANGTASNFASNFGANTDGVALPAIPIIVTVSAYTDANDPASAHTQGLVGRITYTDGTKGSWTGWYNDTRTATQMTFASADGKVPKSFEFTYSTLGNNRWHITKFEVKSTVKPIVAYPLNIYSDSNVYYQCAVDDTNICLDLCDDIKSGEVTIYYTKANDS